MISKESAIAQTKAWLEHVVIGFNFCPFAKKEFVNNTIEYSVIDTSDFTQCIDGVIEQFELLDNNNQIETSLVILVNGFDSFERYLDLVDEAQWKLERLGYQGKYQLASFHPDYVFEGEDPNSASHFTNRSPLPVIHVIREESMAKVLSVYKDPESIPENNIAFAEAKGSEFFAELLLNFKKKVE